MTGLEFLNKGKSNLSEQSEEEDPTEATLIYETKNVKDTSSDETMKTDANKTVYSKSSKVEKVSVNY